MALSLFFLAFLALTCLPLSQSYRDGARSESCYNMVVMHTNFGGQIVSPMECGSSCQYQLRMVGENNLTVEEENSTTYQCGEVYQLQLVSGPGAMFEGFMVEARENTPSFEEGSTIWGTWVTDPNNLGLYHAIECNRSSSSSEGPFENVATQNSPDDLTSLDLYWRAPPPPNTTDELQQLPEEIKFWFVTVQQRLTYFSPIEGPVLERSCPLPSSPTPTPSLVSSSPTYSPEPPTSMSSPPPSTTSSPESPSSFPMSSPPPSTTSSPEPPTSFPMPSPQPPTPSSSVSTAPSSSSPDTTSPSTERPTLAGPIPSLTNAAFIGVIVGAVLGGLLLITLVIVLILMCVYFVRHTSKKKESIKYGRGKKHKNRNLYDAY